MGSITRTVGLRKIEITITAAGIAQPLTAQTLFVTDFELYVDTNNSGASMYIGNKDVDTTWIPRAKNTMWNFVHGTGNFIGRDPVLAFDLSKIYLLSGTLGDRAVIQYYGVDKN